MAETFYLTKSELAAGSFGLYQGELDGIHRKYQPEIDKIKSATACNAFAIAFFALLAAGGAISLLYYSGGPSELDYFVPGIVLGGVSLAFLTWMAIEAIKGTRKKAEEAEKMRLEEEAHVTLEEMRQDLLEGDVVRMQTFLRSSSEKRRTEFIMAVSRDLCSSGHLLKDEQKTKVLSAFLAYPDALIGVVNNEERPFALMLLMNSDPQQVTDQLLDALYQKIGTPTSHLEADLLADQKRIPPAVAAKILEFASPDRNISVFSQAMTSPTSEEEASRLLPHSASVLNRATQDRPFALAMLTHIPKNSDLGLVNSLFGAIGKPRDATEVGTLVRFPEALTRYMEVDPSVLSDHPKTVALLVQKDSNSFNPKRVVRVVQIMTRGNQAIFLGDMAAIAHYMPTVQVQIESVLEAILPTLMVEQASPERTELLKQIVKFPKVVAKYNIGPEFMHELCSLVDPSAQAQFSRAFSLKTWLDGLKQYPEKQSPGSFAIDYFTNNQSQFVPEILDNIALGDKDQRHQYALDLLEHMGDDAARAIINALDVGTMSRGFPQFNALANLLIHEAHANKSPDPASSRSRLMVRFYYSKVRNESKIVASRNSQEMWGCECSLMSLATEAWKSFVEQAQAAADHLKKLSATKSRPS